MKKIMLYVLLASACCLTSCGECLFYIPGDDYPIPVNEKPLSLRPEFSWRLADVEWPLEIPGTNKMIVSGKGNVGLNLKNQTTGITEWTWKDFYNSKSYFWGKPRKDNSCLASNQLLFNSTIQYYCIDLNSGPTKWKKQVAEADRMDDHILTGAGDYYFQVKKKVPLDKARNRDVVFWGNIHSSEPMQELVAPDFQTEIYLYGGTIGNISDLKAFKKSNGQIALAVAYSEPAENGNWNSFIGLWNVDEKEWEYKDILVFNDNVFQKLERVGDLLYSTRTTHVSCFNLLDGELLWKRGVECQLLDVEFSEPYLLLNSNDSKLELVDAASGEIQWTSNEGSKGEVRLSKNFVYILGDHMKILDIVDGTLLKTIDSPYLDYPEEEVAYFSEGCAKLSVVSSQEGQDDLILERNGWMFGVRFGKELKK